MYIYPVKKFCTGMVRIISLFKEIILQQCDAFLQQCDAFKTEIQDSLTKPCAFKASRGHPSKW